MQKKNLATEFWHVVRRSFIDENVEGLGTSRVEAHTMYDLDQKVLSDLHRGKEFYDFTGDGRLSMTSAWYRSGRRMAMVFTVLGRHVYANAVVRFDIVTEGPVSVLVPDTCTFVNQDVAQHSKLHPHGVQFAVDLGQEFDTFGDWVVMVKQPITTDYNYGKFVSYFKPVHPNVRFWNPFADVDALFQREFSLNDLLVPDVDDDSQDFEHFGTDEFCDCSSGC